MSYQKSPEYKTLRVKKPVWERINNYRKKDESIGDAIDRAIGDSEKLKELN